MLMSVSFIIALITMVTKIITQLDFKNNELYYKINVKTSDKTLQKIINNTSRENLDP